GIIRIEALVRDRDQLFAEAVELYRRGTPWWPDQQFEREHIAPEQEQRFDIDAWENLTVDWLRRQTDQRVTVQQVAEGALGVKTDRLGKAEQNRITAIMERAGWRRGP